MSAFKRRCYGSPRQVWETDAADVPLSAPASLSSAPASFLKLPLAITYPSILPAHVTRVTACAPGAVCYRGASGFLEARRESPRGVSMVAKRRDIGPVARQCLCRRRGRCRISSASKVLERPGMKLREASPSPGLICAWTCFEGREDFSCQPFSIALLAFRVQRFDPLHRTKYKMNAAFVECGQRLGCDRIVPYQNFLGARRFSTERGPCILLLGPQISFTSGRRFRSRASIRLAWRSGDLSR